MPRSIPSVDSEEIAIRALGFLAAEPDRVGRFLALTGTDPGEIRSMVRDSRFHAALLDHLLGDEALLTSFAAHEGIDPALIAQARRTLPGGDQTTHG